MRRTLNVGLNEAVTVSGADGRRRLGRIAALDERFITIELLESSAGLTLPDSTVRFHIDDLDFTGLGTLGGTFDVRQVEVLRGPQAGAPTLGGRSKPSPLAFTPAGLWLLVISCSVAGLRLPRMRSTVRPTSTCSRMRMRMSCLK